MIKREMEIREVDNGYFVTTIVRKQDFTAEVTAPSPTIRKELVVDSLPKLLKAARAFFGSEIVEE
jgi:expansin (peptidoglycan-binding protein)